MDIAEGFEGEGLERDAVKVGAEGRKGVLVGLLLRFVGPGEASFQGPVSVSPGPFLAVGAGEAGDGSH